MSTPAPGTVLSTVEDQVGTLTLQHRGKHNAMTGAMWTQLTQAMERLGRDQEVRAVVIRGDGDSFSSGADLRELLAAAGGCQEALDFCTTVATALLAVARCPVPTIAALQRHVTGGGAEIALAADVRLAQDDVVFGIPMGRLGVVPDRLTLQRLTALAGPSTARMVLLGGQQLGATECLRVGLVDRVVGMRELDAATAELAGSFVAGSPYSIRHTKAMMVEAEAAATSESLVEEMVSSLLEGGVADNVRRFLDRPRAGVRS